MAQVPIASTFSDQRPLRIAVLISGGGSTLANLVAVIADGRLARVRIGGVVSSRGAVRGVQIAREAGLPTEIIRPGDHAVPGAFDAAVAAACRAAAADLVVMAGYLCLWRYPAEFEGRVINIHPALLPEFGGAGMFGRHVHSAVLAAGGEVSGCTVHRVDHEYDHGPILAQQQVPVEAADTTETLAARVMAAERTLYPWVLQQVANEGLGWIERAARQPSLFATSSPKLDPRS